MGVLGQVRAQAAKPRGSKPVVKKTSDKRKASKKEAAKPATSKTSGKKTSGKNKLGKKKAGKKKIGGAQSARPKASGRKGARGGGANAGGGRGAAKAAPEVVAVEDGQYYVKAELLKCLGPIVSKMIKEAQTGKTAPLKLLWQLGRLQEDATATPRQRPVSLGEYLLREMEQKKAAAAAAAAQAS